MRSPINRDIDGMKKGPWTQEEDRKLIDYIQNYGLCSWQMLPQKAGLNRCGKSCRLRWTNYLRPDIKRGNFSVEEEKAIIDLHSVLGNKWSMIATHLPGRTDNEIKNFWNTHIRKRLIQSGIDPKTHKPITDFNLLFNLPSIMHHTSNLNNLMNNPILENLSKIRLLFNTLQVLKTNPLPTLSQFDGLFNGIQNPLQFSSKATNLETIEPFSNGYQPVFNAFETIPELVGSEKNGILSNNSTEYRLPALVSTVCEVSSGKELHSDLNCNIEIPSYNQLFTSNNYGDVWGEVMDDEASSSCWNDVFNDSFPL